MTEIGPKSLKIIKGMVEVDMMGNEGGDGSGCDCGRSCLLHAAAELVLQGGSVNAASDLMLFAKGSYGKTCVSQKMRSLAQQLVELNSRS